jgi:hypothetical protein
MGFLDWLEDTFVDPVVDLAEGTANFFEGVGGALSGDNFGESMGKAFGGLATAIPGPAGDLLEAGGKIISGENVIDSLGNMGYNMVEGKVPLPDFITEELGKVIDPYESIPIPEKFKNPPYERVNRTVGLLDMDSTYDQAALLYLLARGGRYGDEVAKAMNPGDVAEYRALYDTLETKNPNWKIPLDHSNSSLQRRAMEGFQAHLNEINEIKKYYRNMLLYETSKQMKEAIREANEQARIVHQAQYKDGVKFAFKTFQETYRWARDNIPGLAGKLDAFEKAFDTVKMGLGAFEKWIDANDVPVLKQIRDYGELQLKAYQFIGKTIPGVDAISEKLLGKKLSEMNYLEMTDTATAFAVPAYGAARSAMELNKAMRESLQNKDELTEEEFLSLVQDYMITELYKFEFEGIGGGMYSVENLDIHGTEVEAETADQPQPMRLIQPSMNSAISKPKVTRAGPAPIAPRSAVSIYKEMPAFNDVNGAFVPGMGGGSCKYNVDDIVPKATNQMSVQMEAMRRSSGGGGPVTLPYRGRMIPTEGTIF